MITPIENAIETISSKNRELSTIIEEYQHTKSNNVNRLSMILNGVIDANVNGGIANYQDVSMKLISKLFLCGFHVLKSLDFPTIFRYWSDDTEFKILFFFLQAFLSDEYLRLNMGDKGNVDKLKVLLQEQVSYLTNLNSFNNCYLCFFAFFWFLLLLSFHTLQEKARYGNIEGVIDNINSWRVHCLESFFI